MKNKSFFKKLVASALILSMFTLAGCGKANVSKEETAYSKYTKLSDTEKEEKITNSTYINEVNYQGEDVPYYLFETPFQITEDEVDQDNNVISSAYVANKDLELSDEDYTLYEESLTNHVNTFLNRSYKDILSNQDEFVSNFLTSLSTDDSEVEQQIYAIEEMYVDHKITTTADISTAKCLMYEDAGMYVLRASIDIRMAGDDTAEQAFEDTFNITLNNGAATVIAEAFFTKDGKQNIIMFTMANIEE